MVGPIGLLYRGCVVVSVATGPGRAVMDIVLGVVGAFVGGILFNAVGGAGVTGFNLYSMVVAVVGAVVVLWIYHAVTGRRAPH